MKLRLSCELSVSPSYCTKSNKNCQLMFLENEISRIAFGPARKNLMHSLIVFILYSALYSICYFDMTRSNLSNGINVVSTWCACRGKHLVHTKLKPKGYRLDIIT